MNNLKSCTDKNLIMEAKFNDMLTSSSYNTLVAELIKYILYHKQQLPYTFDNLKYLVMKKKALENLRERRGAIMTHAEQLFRVAENGCKTLEMIFERTKQEMSEKGRVVEIVLLFGSTPMTPKQVYHIHLPEFYCNHPLPQHSDQKYLLELLQCIIRSSPLNDMLIEPMNPTNMYLFIRKNGKSSCTNNISPWFLPKNRFRIPPTGQHFHIVLSHDFRENDICGCHKIIIYRDGSASDTSPSRDDDAKLDERSGDAHTEWYQACSAFKGFRDVFVNGVSVTNSWTK